jgi:tRNA pseudouridine13 synthase
MFGHKVGQPSEGTPARELEDQIMRDFDISTTDFRPLGKLAPGTRRPLAIPLARSSAKAVDEGVQVRFDLPSGAFATVILREITKNQD